MTNKNEILNKA
jgi:kelch-like protein 20